MIPDLKYAALITLIVSGLNWGLVAFKGEDLLEMYEVNDMQVMGKSLSSVIYTVFAAAAIYLALECFSVSQSIDA